MPTFDVLATFWRDFDKLSSERQRAFRAAVQKLVVDLQRGSFRKGLRVKRVEGTVDIFELTWAPNGRATFQFGDEIRPGEPHVIWRCVGTHDIFDRP